MQLHKRLTIHQVRQTLDWYEQGFMSQAEVLTRLGLKRRRFFDLLKVYRAGQLNSIAPKQRRHVPHKITLGLETAIRIELEADKQLIDNPDITIRFYNYQAIRDTVVEKTGQTVSAQTVRNRAKV